MRACYFPSLKINSTKLFLPSFHRTPNINDLSGFSHFQSLFETALQDYEKQTGMKLAEHPLAKQLELCDSVESVTTVLQQHVQSFSKF